jgi:hypothetical protein
LSRRGALVLLPQSYAQDEFNAEEIVSKAYDHPFHRRHRYKSTFIGNHGTRGHCECRPAR